MVDLHPRFFARCVMFATAGYAASGSMRIAMAALAVQCLYSLLFSKD